MQELITKLFYSDLGSEFNNWVFLGFRVLLMIELMRVHGLKKTDSHHDTPNPLGLPQKLNNLISVFATLYLPLLGVIGFGTRLVILPALMITAIGYFVIHRKDSVVERDVPFMYSLSLLLLVLFGAGTKSVDYWIINNFLH